MEGREEKLRAGKEMLKKFQASKRGSPNTIQGASAVVPSSAPLPSDTTQWQATSFKIGQTTHPSGFPRQEALSDYFHDASDGPDVFQVQQTEAPVEIVPEQAVPETHVNGSFSETASNSQHRSISLVASPAEEESSLRVISEEIIGVLSANLDLAEDSEVVGKIQLAQLEKRNKELEEQVQRQRTTLHQYEAQILSTTSQLQAVQNAFETERQSKDQHFQKETSKIKDELSSHRESIEMLISEKSDIDNHLRKVEASLANKEVEVLSLTQRLQEALAKVNRQESELQNKSFLKEEQGVHGKEVASLQKQLSENRNALDDQKHDISELREKLAAKEKENAFLKDELAKKSSRLEMTELNLVQLRSASSIGIPESSDNLLKEKDAEIASLTAKTEELLKREVELTAYIQQAGHDREQIIHQYTTYCKQLTGQIESVSHQLNEKLEETNVLASREAQLVSHVEQLEGQLQKLIQGNAQQQQRQSSDLDRKELDMMRKQMAELDVQLSATLLERNELQGKCHEKDEELHSLRRALVENESVITDLETRNEMLKTVSPGAYSQDLVAACESDKVAASRAMAQNKQLKDQLEELEMAVINLTNSKADLASELDTLRRKRDNSSESETARQLEVTALQDAVRERDRIIAQMKEQMKHYIAFAENSINGRDSDDDEEKVTKLATQLEEAREEVRYLSSHNSELRSQIEVLSSPTRETSDSPHTPAMSTMSEDSLSGTTLSSSEEEEAEHKQSEVEKYLSNGGGLPETEKQNTTKESSQKFGVPVISHDVAFVKLEQKFLGAMNRVAELMTEKEKLEHLTVQLQEETETVGEYITIYQYQRQQIKRRMEEKDSQLQAVSREREELKSKLGQLQTLVNNFLWERKATEKKNESSTYEIAVEATPEAISSQLMPYNKPDQSDLSKNEVSECKTAEKILALLSEIGANQMLHDDFHPWFWEQSSGKLMTV